MADSLPDRVRQLRHHYNREALTLLIDTLNVFLEEPLVDLQRWLDPDDCDDEPDARARVAEARRFLDCAIGSLEDARRQLQAPPRSEGDRSVPTAQRSSDPPPPTPLYPTAEQVMERDG